MTGTPKQIEYAKDLLAQFDFGVAAWKAMMPLGDPRSPALLARIGAAREKLARLPAGTVIDILKGRRTDQEIGEGLVRWTAQGVKMAEFATEPRRNPSGVNRAQIEEILDRGEYRRYGIRIERKAKVGDILPNSWHNADECDWVEEDTELDGTCVFFLQHADMDSFDSAIGYAASYWPGEQRIVLVGSDSIGTTDVPEDGALCLRHPVVLAVWKQTL